MVSPTPKPVPPGRSASLGNLYRDGVAIFVFEDVLDSIIEFSEQDMAREVGGFLLGGVHRDQFVYIEVRHFLPAQAESQVASLKFTHETWSTMNRQVASDYPDETVVGWHHTHPGLGIFLSEYDLFIHRHFFSQSWQVALVVDPVRQLLGYYQWRNGRIKDCGFLAVQRK